MAFAVLAQPATALEGGSRPRAGDMLAQATVAVGTLLQPTSGFRVSQCSGVLIDSDTVLTAAHCVRDNPVMAAVFFYNGHQVVSSPYPVASVHRVASGAARVLADLSTDVAVLRLANPVRGRVPVRLARDRGQLPPTLRLAGVGLSRRGSGTLNTATLQPIARTETGLTIARSIGARVCIGDSGGPVVVQTQNGQRLWGLASAVVTSRAPCGDIVVIAPAN